MRARYKTLTTLVFSGALAISVILVALQHSPDQTSLSSLQKQILQNGSCNIPVGGPGDIVIEAEMAELENDTLILTRSAETGNGPLVVLSRKSVSFTSKSISIRLLKEPTDMLEFSLDQAEYGQIKVQDMCVRINRHWSLQQWFSHFRAKIMQLFV